MDYVYEQRGIREMVKSSKVLRKRVLVTSAGGPAAENVIGNLIIANDGTWIVGCDSDKYMLQLSSAYRKYLVHPATKPNKYIRDLNKIIKKERITMVYPQSDAEVAVCSAWRKYIKAQVCLPSWRIIQICQDKGKLYEYLKSKGIVVPDFKLPTKEDIRKLLFAETPNYGTWANWYPCWVRARRGAGGNKGFVARDVRDFICMVRFWKEREDVDWMLVKYLGGDDYAWTSIWKDGVLLTSVLKKRIKWVYNRIGTTAVQEIVSNCKVNKYCESIVKVLDPNLTGIMMIDLKQDLHDKQFYITEINAGRLGTVNLFFGDASREIYRDNRVNFPWLLSQICHGGELPETLKKFDALPKGLIWIRHIDFAPVLINTHKT